MKIPKKLHINGFDWDIIWSQDIADEGSCYGSAHLSKQKMFLSPSGTKQKIEETFIHEILHAVWWQQCINNMIDDDTAEEKIINALAFGLYQVLKDNNLLK